MGKLDERSKVRVFLCFAENSKSFIAGVEENSATKIIKTRSNRCNQDHDTVVAGGEVLFNAKNEPSQIKLPSSVQEALSDHHWEKQ